MGYFMYFRFMGENKNFPLPPWLKVEPKVLET